MRGQRPPWTFHAVKTTRTGQSPSRDRTTINNLPIPSSPSALSPQATVPLYLGWMSQILSFQKMINSGWSVISKCKILQVDNVLPRRYSCQGDCGLRKLQGIKCSTRPAAPKADTAISTSKNALSAFFFFSFCLLLELKTDHKPHFFKGGFCLFVRKGRHWVRDRKLYYPVPRHSPYSPEPSAICNIRSRYCSYMLLYTHGTFIRLLS